MTVLGKGGRHYLKMLFSQQSLALWKYSLFHSLPDSNLSSFALLHHCLKSSLNCLNFILQANSTCLNVHSIYYEFFIEIKKKKVLEKYLVSSFFNIQGCKSYSAEAFIKGNTPLCLTKCDDGYNITYNNDKYFGNSCVFISY